MVIPATNHVAAISNNSLSDNGLDRLATCYGPLLFDQELSPPYNVSLPWRG
jgi:hypothetical protein